MLGGTMIRSKYEKRISGDCTQCKNQGVFVDPHAAIRSSIVTKDDAEAAAFPKAYKTLRSTSVESAGQ